MPDSQNHATGLDRARALFAALDLPFPSLPADLADRLRPHETDVFSTIDYKYSPYALQAYVSPMLSGDMAENYAVIGFAGHGVNSHAVHYYLVESSLAIFIQLPWGGVYSDPEKDRMRIGRIFSWASRLRELIARARNENLVPSGWRQIVVVTEFGKLSGWAWLPSPPPGKDQIEWHTGDDITGEAEGAVRQLIDGKTPLA